MSTTDSVRPIRNVSDLDQLRKSILAKQGSFQQWISTCGGTGCSASNARLLRDAFEAALEKHGLTEKVGLRLTGCHGFCEHGPLVVISPEGICYEKVKPEHASRIVEETLLRRNVIEELLHTDPKTKQKYRYERSIPFYKRQRRILLNVNKLIDPTRIDDYIAVNGYEALVKALTRMSPEDVIQEVKSAGLRGRGGAGFPTGFKWEFCRKAKGEQKYVICNADEGDPGAYMDRSILEGNPHSVLEGMIIGAYAIGASEAFVYVRNEYPLAVQHIQRAIEQAKQHGLLGKDILKSGFSLEVHVEKGAGAFVCGEETALIASIEGKTGIPKQRPPFPAVRGLWSKPTNINNVETWANVPLIISRGATYFSQIGTQNSKGTKIFSLVGKVRFTGLVEVPMGTSFREIVYDIGGGILNDRELKAVQIGGPSGGCIPKDLIDLPIDYESLTEAGAIMGSGGMIAMDDRTCMVDVARYFMNFLRDESCGKCLSCREGTQRLYELLTDICEGRGKGGDIELIEELASTVKDASLCGLGQTAGNPVLSTLRYFRREYEEHIRDKKCSAGVCKALVRYEIDRAKCIGCTLCRKSCPQEAISGELKKPHSIDAEKCIKCGICLNVCKTHAVTITQAREYASC
jgi:NADH-quinone oxidoreductase subunit F